MQWRASAMYNFAIFKNYFKAWRKPLNPLECLVNSFSYMFVLKEQVSSFKSGKI